MVCVLPIKKSWFTHTESLSVWTVRLHKVITHPLNKLLKAGQPWKLTPQCEQAFNEAKQRLTEAPVLAHYDPSFPLRQAGDASSYGCHLFHTYVPWWVWKAYCLCMSYTHFQWVKLLSAVEGNPVFGFWHHKVPFQITSPHYHLKP